jgi:hypothetical protein
LLLLLSDSQLFPHLAQNLRPPGKMPSLTVFFWSWMLLYIELNP